ncbi:MAG: VOC family protein [Pseudomonadota bacterium]
MAKVLGIGGFFFHCKDIDATKDWYTRVLGLEINDHGSVMFNHSASSEAFGPGALTVWSPFSKDDDYFQPSGENHMVNFMVDDLTAMLEQCSGEGVHPVKPREDHPYGSFCWILDPDGRKIELWQPGTPPADD